MPAVELLGEAVGAVLGAREDQHLLQFRVLDQVRQQVALALAVHRMDALARPASAAALRASDLDRDAGRAGSRRRAADLVGEGGREQQVLPLLAAAARGSCWMSRMKPMSSMRSASSSTRISSWLKFRLPWPTWSSRRPGVATRISTPARRALVCGLMLTPPKMVAERSGGACHRCGRSPPPAWPARGSA